jgi:cytochrome b subunit of formate dehydrogenase
MDQVAYDTAYAWMSGAIDITWMLWAIAGPLILMRFILKFLGWARRKGKGPFSFSEQEDIEQIQGYSVMVYGQKTLPEPSRNELATRDRTSLTVGAKKEERWEITRKKRR